MSSNCGAVLAEAWGESLAIHVTQANQQGQKTGLRNSGSQFTRHKRKSGVVPDESRSLARYQVGGALGRSGSGGCFRKIRDAENVSG